MLADARAAVRGSLLPVDEARQTGTEQMSKLLTIAQRLDVAHAFDLLRLVTMEVQRVHVPTIAAGL